MSLPVVLPGSCCPVTGGSQLVEPFYRNRPRGLSSSSRIAGGSRLLLPGRPLLSLGLLQLLLGGSMVALSFGALSLSRSPPIRNSCPFWAGSSVILSGIVGLTTWRRPMLLLVNVFVLLSVVCVLLNLAGFILCCQGAQLVSSMTSCQLGIVQLCSIALSALTRENDFLQKVLFALCALNALTTAVCLMAAALRYLQIFTARTPCMDEPRATVEEREEPAQVSDPDEFVAPAPPPSYFSTFYSYTPRLARRMLGDSVIPLPHIYGARIKGVEVFCPLDPPPPYEAVAGSSANVDTQETEIALTELTMNPHDSPPGASVQGSSPQMVSASPGVAPQTKPQLQLPPHRQQQHSPTVTPWRKARIHRSNSDPVLLDIAAKVQGSSDAPLAPSPQTTDSSTQTSQPTLATQGHVTLRRGNDSRMPRRPRPSSMVDYQSYQHTQQLVRKILEQPAAQGLAPEVQELVDSIRNVLQSDQEHMEEAVRCASYIEQEGFIVVSVITFILAAPSKVELSVLAMCSLTQRWVPDSLPKPPRQNEPAGSSSQTFPRPPRRRPGLLHLQSCGDLSSFTCAAAQSVEHRGNSKKVGSRVGFRADSRAGSRTGSRLDHPERPHSLIGVFRETVL
ncbi:hypothetical protein L3Q82_022680 [Scortum barcoo]|uniref:Uncharacterized protein n=1 Tax=Scortum barcoo TaxID=214431 RepID=A0ACB8WXR4_9TELE|nr:hypothetical protein L3Q82_022680 [Scortum barcoo]